MKKIILGFAISSLSVLGLACSNSSHQTPAPASQPASQATPAPKKAETTSATTSQGLAPAHFAKKPTNVLTDEKSGCTMNGPYQGEITSEAIGEPLAFDAAVRKCAAMGAECFGITTDWYVDKPYTLRKVAPDFRPDTNSYAVSYMNKCK